MYKIVIIFFAISLVPAVVTAQPQVELVRAYDFDRAQTNSITSMPWR